MTDNDYPLIEISYRVASCTDCAGAGIFDPSVSINGAPFPPASDDESPSDTLARAMDTALRMVPENDGQMHD